VCICAYENLRIFSNTVTRHSVHIMSVQPRATTSTGEDHRLAFSAAEDSAEIAHLAGCSKRNVYRILKLHRGFGQTRNTYSIARRCVAACGSWLAMDPIDNSVTAPSVVRIKGFLDVFMQRTSLHLQPVPDLKGTSGTGRTAV